MRLIPVLSAMLLAAPLCANGWKCGKNRRYVDKNVGNDAEDVEDSPEVLKLARKRIDDLQDEVQNRKSKELTLEKELKDRRRQAREREIENQELHAKVAKLDKVRGEKQTLKDELYSLKTTLRAEVNARKRAERELETSEKARRALKAKADERAEKERQLDAEIRRLSAENADGQKAARKMRLDLVNANENVAKMEEMLKTSEEKAKTTCQKYDVKSANERDTQLRVLRAELELVKLEKEDAEEELAQARDARDEIASEREKREKEIKDELDEALEKKKDLEQKLGEIVSAGQKRDNEKDTKIRLLEAELDLVKLEKEDAEEELKQALIDLEARKTKSDEETNDKIAEIRKEKEDIEEKLRVALAALTAANDDVVAARRELKEKLQTEIARFSSAATEIKTLNDNIASRDIAIHALQKDYLRCVNDLNGTEDAKTELRTLHSNLAEMNRENRNLRQTVKELEMENRKTARSERDVPTITRDKPDAPIERDCDHATLALVNVATILVAAYLAFHWGKAQGTLDAGRKEIGTTTPVGEARKRRVEDVDTCDTRSVASTRVTDASSIAASRTASSDSETGLTKRRQRQPPSDVSTSVSDTEDDADDRVSATSGDTARSVHSTLGAFVNAGDGVLISAGESEEDFEVIRPEGEDLDAEDVVETLVAELASSSECVECGNGDDGDFHDARSPPPPMRLVLRLNSSRDDVAN